jgi:hypothetical protein
MKKDNVKKISIDIGKVLFLRIKKSKEPRDKYIIIREGRRRRLPRRVYITIWKAASFLSANLEPNIPINRYIGISTVSKLI